MGSWVTSTLRIESDLAAYEDGRLIPPDIIETFATSLKLVYRELLVKDSMPYSSRGRSLWIDKRLYGCFSKYVLTAIHTKESSQWFSSPNTRFYGTTTICYQSRTVIYAFGAQIQGASDS